MGGSLFRSKMATIGQAGTPERKLDQSRPASCTDRASYPNDSSSGGLLIRGEPRGARSVPACEDGNRVPCSRQPEKRRLVPSSVDTVSTVATRDPSDSSACVPAVDHPRLVLAMASILQRATAWLCLAVAVLTGLTPAHGFVLCLEPDGDVCIEVDASAEKCSGCVVDSHNAAPVSEQAVTTDVPCCPCLDLPVPGFSQDRQILPKASEIQIGPWIANVAPLVRLSIPSSLATSHRTPDEAPRPPDSLALIRTVVLLV